jgi:glucose/arabinose dehydrogenase
MASVRVAAAALVLCALLPIAAVAVDPDQQPGQRVRVDLNALPQPYAPPSRANPPRTIPKPADAKPRVPPGFAVTVFADKLGNARNVVVAPNGDVFLVRSSEGMVSVLRDDGGKAKSVATFAQGFNTPHGLAFAKDAVLIGDLDGVWKIPYTAGDTVARVHQQRITAEGAFGDPAGHYTRNVVVSPDGAKIYVAIGSRGNIAEEPEPRATIQEFAIDGSRQRTFATGLRNAVGLAFAPGTNDLYAVVNERDTAGDELVPDYLAKIVDGGFYGWPYAYMGAHEEPKMAGKRPDLVAKALVPETPFRSHSAPVGMVFATGTQFPKEYQGGAFVALHGSWNATPPRGYIVAYVPFVAGRPADSYVVFAAGFWAGNEQRPEVWGRPSGVAMMKDGSLLIADEVSGTLWRVSYKGK